MNFSFSFEHKLTLSDLSSLFSFLVSCLALIYAVRANRKADRDSGVNRQREKKAQVADGAMKAVITLTAYLSNRATDTTPEKPDILALEAVSMVWESADHIFDQVWTARAEVEVHLPGALSAMIDLQKFADTLRERQIAFAKAFRGRLPLKDPDTVYAFGPVPEEQIRKLRENAKAALLPYARREK